MIEREEAHFNVLYGAFKYYVIMFLTFLGPPTQFFDDLQYCKSSRIAIFWPHPPTYLFDDAILEWAQINIRSHFLDLNNSEVQYNSY